MSRLPTASQEYEYLNHLRGASVPGSTCATSYPVAEQDVVMNSNLEPAVKVAVPVQSIYHLRNMDASGASPETSSYTSSLEQYSQERSSVSYPHITQASYQPFYGNSNFSDSSGSAPAAQQMATQAYASSEEVERNQFLSLDAFGGINGTNQLGPWDAWDPSVIAGSDAVQPLQFSLQPDTYQQGHSGELPQYVQPDGVFHSHGRISHSPTALDFEQGHYQDILSSQVPVGMLMPGSEQGIGPHSLVDRSKHLRSVQQPASAFSLTGHTEGCQCPFPGHAFSGYPGPNNGSFNLHLALDERNQKLQSRISQSTPYHPAVGMHYNQAAIVGFSDSTTSRSFANDAPRESTRNQGFTIGSARKHPYYDAPPQADGLYHCPFEGQEGCTHKPEKLKCSYHKNIDSHRRPYRCKVRSCVDAQFSSTACLLRHEREAHGMHGHGDKPYECCFPRCDRAQPGKGFPRRWNLNDHMKRVHNYSGAPSPTGSSSPTLQGVATRSLASDKQTSRKRRTLSSERQSKKPGSKSKDKPAVVTARSPIRDVPLQQDQMLQNFPDHWNHAGLDSYQIQEHGMLYSQQLHGNASTLVGIAEEYSAFNGPNA